MLMSHYSAEQLMYLDESGVNEPNARRTHGFAPKGRKARVSRVLKRTPGWSILPGLTVDGFVALHIYQGAYNADLFYDFVEKEVLPNTTPFPGPRSVIVMDNVRFHHDPRIAEILSYHGRKCIYLPPYSPDLNPIKECFGIMKQYMRKHGKDSTEIITNPYYFYWETAKSSITPEIARSMFQHAGISAEVTHSFF
ncbi:hypothetical protein G7K_3391-t1 [Saitoella complicata NRRL Y-17804]|uniref:Tc1-like transposase DDE domain-containing protein n=1 Tax=Saitoella complicata (strain BCRC 22490 / CBS 7301 / JCM 7358 / NBRC 10748 / NRRL Y-17804) TaxID=698492 RepID=A0A0E9NH74_SAICN|nr:hypothetical protein G7K_3391-t1 [Saitoella complicata NRRL Y-17804]